MNERSHTQALGRQRSAPAKPEKPTLPAVGYSLVNKSPTLAERDCSASAPRRQERHPPHPH
ncbi:MAG: hypothetical protein ACREOH_22535, partial [Candidatus Entotheonellia bacterium]